MYILRINTQQKNMHVGIDHLLENDSEKWDPEREKRTHASSNIQDNRSVY